jgi:hypothetical protein
MSLISKYNGALKEFDNMNPKYAVNRRLEDAKTKSAFLFLFKRKTSE